MNDTTGVTSYLELEAVHLNRGWLPAIRELDGYGKQTGFKFLNHLLKKTKRGAIGAARRVAQENYPQAIIR